MKKKILITTAIISLGVVIIYLTAPKGGIVYFNPGDLKLYDKTELTIPFTSIPIYRSSKHYDGEYEIISYLIKKGWIKREPRENYQDIFVSHWSPTWHDGYIIIHKKLHDHQETLIPWCEEYPDVAKLLWQDIIAKLRENWEKHEQYAITMINYTFHLKTIDEFMNYQKEYNEKGHL